MQLDRVCEQLTVAQMANGERCRHLLEGNGQSAEVPLFQSFFWREMSIFSSFWRETTSLQKWPPFCNFWEGNGQSAVRFVSAKYKMATILYFFGGKCSVSRSGCSFSHLFWRETFIFSYFWREMSSRQKGSTIISTFWRETYIFSPFWREMSILWFFGGNAQSAEAAALLPHWKMV